VSFALSSLTVISILIILGLVGRDILWRAIYIEPISVPKTLSDEGYGPDIASRRLAGCDE
jgi:hypothetical protein